MSPRRVVRTRIAETGHTIASLALKLDVPVTAVVSLIDGDSPDAAIQSRLPGALGLEAEFWRALYSAPGRVRNDAVESLLADAA